MHRFILPFGCLGFVCPGAAIKPSWQEGLMLPPDASRDMPNLAFALNRCPGRFTSRLAVV
jgi:hypothetical protein